MGKEEVEVMGLDAPPLSAIQAITSAEVDIQVVTAHRFPRDVKTAVARAMSMATTDEETAASCFYSKPQGDEDVKGPGVRLAEIFIGCWGNIRCETRIVNETDKFIVARGTTWDMETNTLMACEVYRSITTKYGRKYSNDMIATTANAAGAIAFRNSVFKVIPKMYVNKVYEEAKRVAIGDAKTLGAKRKQVIDRLKQIGAKEAHILAKIGKESIDRIDLTDIEKLIGLGTAIKDGDMTVEEAFPKPLDVKEPMFNKTDPAATAPATAPAESVPPETAPVDTTPVSPETAASVAALGAEIAEQGALAQTIIAESDRVEELRNSIIAIANDVFDRDKDGGVVRDLWFNKSVKHVTNGAVDSLHELSHAELTKVLEMLNKEQAKKAGGK